MKDNQIELLSEQIRFAGEIKQEWLKKRYALRLAEAKQSDVNQLHQIETDLKSANNKIEEADKEIKELEGKIKELSSNTQQLPEPSFLSNEDIVDDELKVLQIFKQEIAVLGLNSAKDDISKLLNIKSKLNESIFKDLDTKISFLNTKKQLIYTSAIFDKIYASNELDDVLKQEIQKIRDNKEEYKDYDRSLIVSGLSLSLINFKFDRTKANLLLDFITDFEDNVWERALTGLMLALLYQNNSWYRHEDFRKRLEVLKEFEKVQQGIKLIDFVLKNKIYKMNIFHPSIFENSYFQNPMNCFVPFFKNNEIFQEVVDNAKRDFDVIKYEANIYDLPVMDILKYSISFSIIQEQNEEINLDEENESRINKIELLKLMKLNSIFNPYQSLLGEYYYFFSYFPTKYKNDVFKNELIISNTKLKDIILNKVLELLLSGNSLYYKEEYNAAIQKFNSLLKLEEKNVEALFQIGNCYWELNKMNDALKYYSEVEKIVEKIGKDLLFRMANTYSFIEKYDKALQYCEKIEQLGVKPSFNFLILKADCYYELHMYEKAIKICEEAENYILDGHDMCKLAQTYNLLDKNHRALEFAIKSVEVDNNYVQGLRILGVVYTDLYDWDKAINSLKKANHIDRKNTNILMTLGRAYVLSNTDFKQGEQFLEKALKLSPNEGVIYGNLGHLYLIRNDLPKALFNYGKCIRLLKDEKEFIKRCNLDTKFIVNAGITENKYIETRDNVITDFLNNK